MNARKKRTELRKFISRDICLFSAEWFRDILREKFKKTLGVGYSDWVNVGNGLSITFYQIPEDNEAVKRAFIRKMKSDPAFYEREARTWRANVTKTKLILKKLEGKAKFDAKTVELLKERYYLLFPVGRITLVGPTAWAADIRKELGAKAEGLLKTLFADRLHWEGTFEAIDAALREAAAKSLTGQGINGRFAKFLTEDEAMQLATGRQIDAATLIRRSKGFVLCKGKILSTNDCLKIFRENGYDYEEETHKGGDLVGTVAFNGGIVRGKAMQIHAIEQVPHFKPGRVLISPMTIPDFVPALKKAVAVVTDEGGITCHAAIVSRELRIPCVIGTKFATKLFKDGDLLEVDTRKGVVRKLLG